MAVGSCRPPTYIPPDVRELVATSTALDVRWRLALGTQTLFAADPVERAGVALSTDGRTLIAAVSAGDLVGIDTSTGDARWRIELGNEPFTCPPTVYGEHVFIGTPDGSFRSYHADSGGLVWSADLGEVYNSAATVDDELVVISTAAGRLVAIERETGHLLWQRDRSAPSQLSIAGGPSPAFWGDAIYVGFPDGALGAFDRDGSEIWLTDLAAGESRLRDVDTTPLVADDGVYAASFSGGLYRVDRTTGDIVWRADVTGATSPIAVDESLVTSTANGSVLWLDPADGTVTAELSLDEDAAGPINRSGDYLMLGEPHDGLYIIASTRPWIHARFHPDSGFSSQAVARGDTIYALSDAGFAYAIRMVPHGR